MKIRSRKIHAPTLRYGLTEGSALVTGAGLRATSSMVLSPDNNTAAEACNDMNMYLRQ